MLQYLWSNTPRDMAQSLRSMKAQFTNQAEVLSPNLVFAQQIPKICGDVFVE